MDQVQQRETGRNPASEEARILWQDPDTGARLWLGLRASRGLLEDLERAGFEVRWQAPACVADRSNGPQAA